MTATDTPPVGPLGPPQLCPTCHRWYRELLMCRCSHAANAPQERGHLMNEPFGRQKCLYPGCGCKQYRPDQEAAT